MTFRPGTTLQGGRYQVESILGKGGFGLTYRALHVPLGLTVVVKTLQERLRRSPQYSRFRNQLLTEAQTLANFHHPSIVRVVDLFEEDQYPCVVMDYIPGVTLASLARPDSPLDERYAIYYIRQVAAALIVIHSQGFVHRDVKPKNILCRDRDHRAILIDFGIVQTPNPEQRQTRALSANYAPPEQYNLHCQLTPAADVYALSATLYYLLSGKAPVPAFRRQQQNRLPSLCKFQTHLTPGLEQAVIQGMMLNPDQRPQSIQEWLELLPSSISTPAFSSELSPVSELPVIASEPSSSLLHPLSAAKKQSFTASSVTKSEKTIRVSPPGVAKANGVVSGRSIQISHPFRQQLVQAAIISAFMGGLFAFALRLAAFTSKPLLEFQQSFPDTITWPGSTSPAETAVPTATPQPPTLSPAPEGMP